MSRGMNLIEDVSFSVAPGRTLCLVGESGCGKSLTALSLLGLLPPAAEVTGGTIRFAGQDVLALSERERADLRGDRVAMIFQEPMTSLNPAFTIGDQIGEGVLRHRGGTREAARARALELLRRVRIPAPEKRLDAYPHQLSGGMRQRVMIAMALANDPKLLVADEPTTALDVTIQAQILALIKRLQEESGTALVLITHDLGVVAEVADEVAVMYGGLIVERGPVTAVFDDPQHPYTIGLMGSVPSLGRRTAKLATIPGTVPPPALLPAGCRFAGRCPFADARCAAEPPPVVRFGAGHEARCWFAPLETTLGEAA
ncbi:ABC transporter ATP-binding protein [Prosthecomicrobium sp. N25]|uniref:ABC transporter ATP-binding protein n=1 Tax=Prosthecomicrobium sp. N25 TaxID=3129254 RepID=UPI00307715B4